MLSTIQPKFIPKKPVTTESGRKIVEMRVRRSVTALARSETAEAWSSRAPESWSRLVSTVSAMRMRWSWMSRNHSCASSPLRPGRRSRVAPAWANMSRWGTTTRRIAPIRRRIARICVRMSVSPRSSATSWSSSICS